MLAMTKYIVATTAELPSGSRKIIEIAGRSIGVFNVAGQFFALRNRCPHQAGPLCQGLLSSELGATVPGDYQLRPDKKTIRCPWHGWEFELNSGQSWFDPTKVRVKPYPVSVATATALDPETMSKGPYVAETYPVTIEETYVVVEI
jgi:3-phenylpropionate/trans-cinnamate dioxygenase ferredoxin subunit